MFNQISSNILLGIIAGVTATGITLFIRSFWRKVMIPWYEERVYKDAKIEGSWDGEILYNGDGKEIFVFDIRRQGHKITGEMVSKNFGKIYNFDGEFRNMILTIVYSSRNQHEIDRGCFTFLLQNNGYELLGNSTFYSNPHHKVKTGPIKLTRHG